MKKLLAAFGIMLCAIGVTVADTTQPPALVRRVSVFSTSTDWQAITGLLLNEYRGILKPDSKLIGTKGLELYYLDGFPCYGLGDGVRVWLGPNNKHDGDLRIACVYAPETINFSWRNATRDADDGRGTGLLTCPVDADGRDLTIDLSKCVLGKDWSEYK